MLDPLPRLRRFLCLETRFFFSRRRLIFNSQLKQEWYNFSNSVLEGDGKCNHLCAFTICPTVLHTVEIKVVGYFFSFALKYSCSLSGQSVNYPDSVFIQNPCRCICGFVCWVYDSSVTDSLLTDIKCIKFCFHLQVIGSFHTPADLSTAISSSSENWARALISLLRPKLPYASTFTVSQACFFFPCSVLIQLVEKLSGVASNVSLHSLT